MAESTNEIRTGTKIDPSRRADACAQVIAVLEALA